MADADQQPIDDNEATGTPDGQSHRTDEPYSLGEPAKTVYDILAGAHRQIVIEAGRDMASITIPSVSPPLAYRTGDYLPGTNQSISAAAINNLASKIMFMAFPPGQPMLRLVPEEQKLQAQIDQDPGLYARIQLALSRVELAHREEASTIGIATAWEQYIKLLLVCGNALWKHVTLECPTFHHLDYYVVQRDIGGHPLLTIHKSIVHVNTLDDDIQEIIYKETPDLLKQAMWTREVDLYSVCRLKREGSKKKEDWHWEYWEETEDGTLLPGTEMDTDYDDCPMWPGWLIPVYGQSYGRSYCEEYKGDLYILESNSSSLNDGAAGASLMLIFVKPGSRTSLKQVQKSPNLSFLSGDAGDMSTYRADKQADFEFVAQNVERASTRIGKAFCVTGASMRQGERVTAEEVARTGAELDQAMGGVFTQIAQTHQRVMVKRFVKLHNESNDAMPSLPPNLVKVEVITGVDAMGRSAETASLKEFAADIAQTFPQQAAEVLVATDYATRLASSMGIKPDGLVQSQQQIDAKQQQAQQQALQAKVTANAAGPLAGAAGQAMADRLPPGAKGSTSNPMPSQQQGAAPPNGQ